eukprot:2040933-Alexandrium_andersonii.AAC.1
MQQTRALSSGESEFYAIGSGASRGLFVNEILLNCKVQAKLVLFSDSSAGRGVRSRYGVGH